MIRLKKLLFEQLDYNTWRNKSDSDVYQTLNNTNVTAKDIANAINAAKGDWMSQDHEAWVEAAVNAIKDKYTYSQVSNILGKDVKEFILDFMYAEELKKNWYKNSITTIEDKIESLTGRTTADDDSIMGTIKTAFSSTVQDIKSKATAIIELSSILYGARSAIWNPGLMKTILNVPLDMIELTLALIEFSTKNPGYDDKILMGAISILFRESKANYVVSYVNPKEILAWADNHLKIAGGNHSTGYAGIKPSLAKQFGFSLSEIETLLGSLNAAYTLIDSNYNTAIQKDFDTDNESVQVYDKKTKQLTNTPAIGNNPCLHVALAAHNGESVLEKYCETDTPGLATACSIEQRKHPQIANKIIRTYQDRPIKNYFANIGSSPGTHNYIKNVAKAYNYLEANNFPTYMKNVSNM